LPKKERRKKKELKNKFKKRKKYDVYSIYVGHHRGTTACI
jgi:hypothetical protein